MSDGITDSKDALEVWVTKYWNTKGILHYIGAVVADDCSFVKVPDMDGLNGEMMYKGADCHFSLENARAHFEVLRKKKIASLKKQIAKIEVMNADVVHRTMY
jgi:hypothetical protein